MTISDTHVEISSCSNVVSRYPWLSEEVLQSEVAASCLKLREPKKGNIEKLAKYLRQHGNKLLEKLLIDGKIKEPRQISLVDARVLATAEVLSAAVATDEWPLALVADELSEVHENGGLLNSLDLLNLMELGGNLDKGQRVETVRSWCQNGELLPRNWREHYLNLFNEAPPDGQSSNTQST
ncbi:hypothetical protein [Polynucleobacter sp. Fuers-14]|uniref:hypothetical protein n=1 Tax=Polynucleobacter sp. Fuers-14 TaxID=1758364 RepID=UPI001C0C717B|nr:hypothetical protein [Polynucleobacter sp. Fuers-14]MBU3640818.1 hypothetical protein [Polynucleobacter sp. Fuers-14]